jgi:hypothetical protein
MNGSIRTTLFTGAGASRAIGYPLTRDLLPQVRDEIARGLLFEGINGDEKDRSDREELKRYLISLYPGFEQVSAGKLPLITDVFLLVEYSLSVGEALAVGNASALRRFRELLMQAITDVLMGEFDEPWDENDPEQRSQREVLHSLIDWVIARRDGFGLVTTNYDIGMDYDLYDHIGPDNIHGLIDLGYDYRHVDHGGERRRPAVSSLHVYKLHGSLDTLRCPTCGYIYFNPFGAIAYHAFRKLCEDNTCHCRDDVRLDLHIVSPSLVREVRDANLLSVWRSALEWMRRSEHWVIVGYSLPPEDLGVRSLLSRAYRTTGPQKPRVTVVQHGDEARPAYELLFPDCEYFNDGLAAFLRRESAR